MSYQYGQEARERISALGQNKISEFIEEVPHAYRKEYCDRQPAISGFRSRSPTEFKEKQKRLIGHILNPQGGQKGDADWKMFANFWVAWARSQLGEDFPVGDRSAPAADAGPAFLKSLADQFPDASRETLERLISFSGFADHADTQAALGRFRPASTLARDRMIDGLPGRLSKIEGYFEIAETAAEEVAEQIVLLESEVAALIKNADDVSSRLKNSIGDVSDLRSLVDEAATRTEHLENAIEELDGVGRKTLEAVAASDRKAQMVKRGLDALSDKAQGWDEAASLIAELKELVTQIHSREPDRHKAAEAVVVLSARIEELQDSFAKMGTGSGPRPQQVRLFEVEPQGPLVEIHTVETACELISCNLQASGIVKGAAISVARQILAALAAGQLVQFSGSLADLVAEAVAAAVGGPRSHEWRVPVGLVSDEAAADCLDAIVDISGCLVLKGANRSAFEVYGTAIRDVVARRQLSVAVHHRLALVGSWAQGPAAFPDGGTLAELGPVFDTDNWAMRGVSSRLPHMKYGYLKDDSWDHIHGFDDNAPSTLVADLRQLLDEAKFKPGNLWTRSADRAYLRLRATPGGSEEEDLHAILMLWAFPWAKAMNGPSEDLASVADRILSQHQAESAHFEGA
jgi:hypothetical protein